MHLDNMNADDACAGRRKKILTLDLHFELYTEKLSGFTFIFPGPREERLRIRVE